MILAFVLLLVTTVSIFVSPATVNTGQASNILADIEELSMDMADLKASVNAIPSTGSNFGSVANLGAVIDPTDAETIMTQITTLQSEVLQTIPAFTASKDTIEDAFPGAGAFALTTIKTMIDVSASFLPLILPTLKIINLLSEFCIRVAK
ncbi:hypothetical protein Clacol_005907 [Clathrus columnatus]|uniref:Uncharacterized protein n=1 Tax=Clathrus columnatus TaxID=1419009 RepID=A0AAV5AAL3_9AGAM|nr:hypothetical protein Clacol_005907 [Clathrus columnatus]